MTLETKEEVYSVVKENLPIGKTIEKQQKAPKPIKESKYPIKALIEAHDAFNVPFEVVKVALSKGNKQEYTENEAKSIIQAFLKSPVTSRNEKEGK